MTDTHPPNWYPDPFGRHELRYFDGSAWTEHVSSHGKQSVDPPDPGSVPTDTKVMGGRPDAAEVQAQVTNKAGVTGAFQGGGTVFTEPILVVNQRAKIIEINNEYAIYDQSGTQIGAVRQVGQSTGKKVLRALTSFDQFLTHKLQVIDMVGNVQLAITRPAKFIKSKVVISDGAGREIGTVAQENMVGKIRFGFIVGGQRVGGINAENWRAWNFNITDADGNEVARITKTFEGLAKTLFTTADNYVLQIHAPLEEPLRSMVVASALSVDTALKQDSRGIG